MNQKADHPHQAAVHLMKSLKCCRECSDVSEIDYAEIGELQYERDVLARELAQMGNPEQDLELVTREIHDLEFLIAKVREENEIAYQTGLQQIDSIVQDRQMFERQKKQGLHVQLIAERDRYRSLTAEIERQMERTRYLHRINEELVHRFCRF